MFKSIKKGNFYVVPKAIARLKEKHIEEVNPFDNVFLTYYVDFQKRSDQGDEQSYEALKEMTYLEINNYFWLAVMVLYVDVAPHGTFPSDAMQYIGEDGVKDLRDSFQELGFTEEEIDFNPNSVSLLSEYLMEELKKRQSG